MAKPQTEKRVENAVRPIAELAADPKNARRHSERQIAQIAGSIERFGFVNPIVIRPDGTIIGGHATIAALQRLQRTEVEVRVVIGLTTAQYEALGLALNRIPENSSWDDGILADIVGDLDEAGEDLTGIGFGERELASLREGPDAIEVHEIETSTVVDEFWISVRGPLKDQAAALKAMEAAMKPFTGITVDLGTIAMDPT